MPFSWNVRVVLEAAQPLTADHHKLIFGSTPLSQSLDLNVPSIPEDSERKQRQSLASSQLSALSITCVIMRKPQQKLNKTENTFQNLSQNHPHLGVLCTEISWKICIFVTNLKILLRMLLISEGYLSLHPKTPERILHPWLVHGSLAHPTKCSHPCLHSGITRRKTTVSCRSSMGLKREGRCPVLYKEATRAHSVRH